MKYYTLGISDDINVIGEYPQVEKASDYNLSTLDSYWNVYWNKTPDFSPIYKIKIRDKAIATNLLNSLSGFYGLSVDENLKNLLNRFNLPEHHFYPIEVSYLKKGLNYYWFHFVDSLFEYVDFNNTTFDFFKKSPYKIIQQFKLLSLDELHKKESELTFEYGIRLNKLVLKPDFPQFDIISLWGITPLFLVSDKLKNELEKSDLTGFIFNEYQPLFISQTPPLA